MDKPNQINIMMSLELPSTETPKHLKPRTLKEKVVLCLDLIETEDPKAAKAWEYIKKINNKLMKKDKLSASQDDILKLIYNMISKYGQQDPDGVELDADKIIKYVGKNPVKSGRERG